MSNPYRHPLTYREHMIKNDKDKHNAGEKETESPRHAVAKKRCRDLHNPA
jgi:hypothetical protein